MDETGFALRTTQSTRIIIDSVQKARYKVALRRQEWVTVLKCINASGDYKAIPPMIIFKAKNTNSSWIPAYTPSNWHFLTSANS